MRPTVIARSAACERAAQSSSSIHGFHEEMVAERPRSARRRVVARLGAAEKRAKDWAVVVFLNRGGLEVVELGQNELLKLRIAARHMNVERRPGSSQKYL